MVRFEASLWTVGTLQLTSAFSPLAGVFGSVKFEPAGNTETTQTLANPIPYAFPDQNAANTDQLFPMPECHGKRIEEADIDTLQEYLSDGSLTSQQLAICYLQRIWQTNEYINAVLEINPDFLQIAAELDKERKAGHVRGPLHGIPTCSGSWALQGSVVPRDAHVVAKLRSAGALLFGKSTLSEWADMRSNNYSEGYSGRGGQCRSAYNLTVNPGGSSSGSAVGVAANVFPFALGTETDGSVVNPAERNAIVGIKPTVGLTSRAGTIPESEHQDSVGCFGKTVRDATYVLDAIYGPDPHDNYTQAQIGKTPKGGYTPFLTSRHALRNATFGIPWETFWIYADAEQQKTLLAIVDLLKGAGATIINGTELPSRHQLISPNGWDWDYGTTRGYPNESEYTYVKVDFYNNIATYLSTVTNTHMRSLADIVAYNIANSGAEGGHPYPDGHPAFYSGQDGLLASLATGGKRTAEYWTALNFCRHASRERGIDAALRQVQLHVRSPTSASAGAEDRGKPHADASPTHQTMGGMALLVPPDVAQTYQVAAQAGYPVITVPAGVHAGTTGMPFGLALMHTAWREDALVRWASAIEDLLRATPYGRTRPRWFGHLERNIPVRNL